MSSGQLRRPWLTPLTLPFQLRLLGSWPETALWEMGPDLGWPPRRHPRQARRTRVWVGRRQAAWLGKYSYLVMDRAEFPEQGAVLSARCPAGFGTGGISGSSGGGAARRVSRMASVVRCIVMPQLGQCGLPDSARYGLRW